MNKIKPYIRPFEETTWGGTKISEMYGKELGLEPGQRVGEVWFQVKTIQLEPMIKHRRKHKEPRLKKDKCEICGLNEKGAIELHHIIPRSDPRCNNLNANLTPLCGSCHNLVHCGEITIIGVYHTTSGRELMWFRRGQEPPLEKQFWKIQDNPLVVTNNAIVQHTQSGNEKA